MYRFVKDTRREWDSKLDRLSMGIAGRLGGEYWVPGQKGVPCLVQGADGRCAVPAGCPVSVAVFHDGLEYEVKKNAPFRVGLGDIPGCHVNLAGYPLYGSDLCRVGPSVQYDAVVGGACGDGWEAALEDASLDGKRVAVAFAGDDGIREGIVAALSGRNEVDVIDGPVLPVVAALYRTCGTVVHLGHCRRGYLHSLAVYHAGVSGRKLVEGVPGEKFVPPSLDEMIKILGRQEV